MFQDFERIYLAYSPLLIIQLTKKYLFPTKTKLKYFHGIYLKTNNEDNPIINNLKEIKDYPIRGRKDKINLYKVET